jgi:DNA-binding MarR family transcriptional regulator
MAPMVPVDALRAAKKLYEQRRAREQFLPGELLAEPAWDLLLALYIARGEGKPVTTTAACSAAAVPTSTAHRWLVKLERDGHVTRSRGSVDERLSLVELTDMAFDRMTMFLLPVDPSGGSLAH